MDDFADAGYPERMCTYACMCMRVRMCACVQICTYGFVDEFIDVQTDAEIDGKIGRYKSIR